VADERTLLVEAAPSVGFEVKADDCDFWDGLFVP
jgi:hypothetical protein